MDTYIIAKMAEIMATMTIHNIPLLIYDEAIKAISSGGSKEDDDDNHFGL
jgi:hypothetical protein